MHHRNCKGTFTATVYNNSLFCKTSKTVVGKRHGLTLQMSVFLGVFAKVRKGTFNFVMSVRPSASPHGINRLPLDGLIKTCREKSNFVKIWQ